MVLEVYIYHICKQLIEDWHFHKYKNYTLKSFNWDCCSAVRAPSSLSPRPEVFVNSVAIGVNKVHNISCCLH